MRKFGDSSSYIVLIAPLYSLINVRFMSTPISRGRQSGAVSSDGMWQTAV